MVYSIAPTGQEDFASSYFFCSSGVSGCLISLAGIPSTLKSSGAIAAQVPHPMHVSFMPAMIICNKINILSFYRPPKRTFIVLSFIRNDVHDVHRCDDALDDVLLAALQSLLRRRVI